MSWSPSQQILKNLAVRMPFKFFPGNDAALQSLRQNLPQPIRGFSLFTKKLGNGPQRPDYRIPLTLLDIRM